MLCRIGPTSIFFVPKVSIGPFETDADVHWEAERSANGAPEPGLDGLGGRLRELRRRRGLTLEEVASGAGITLGYLSQIERDMTVPALPTLARIAAQLDVPIAGL